MGRIYSIILLFLPFCMPVSAMTQYQSTEETLRQRELSYFFTSDSLSSAKSRTIKYRSGYSLTAQIHKKTLVPGSLVDIRDSEDNSVFKGVVVQTEGTLLAEGVRYLSNGRKVFGSFAITNTTEASFSLKPKDGEAPEFSLTRIDYIYDSDFGNPVIYEHETRQLYSMCTKKGGYKSLSSPVSIRALEKIATASARELLLSTGSNVEIFWENRSFKGFAEPIETGSSPIVFIMLTGTIDYSDGKTTQVSSLNGTLTLTKAQDGNIIKKYSIPQNKLDKADWWNEAEYIKQTALLEEENSTQKVTRTIERAAPSIYDQQEANDHSSDYSAGIDNVDSESGSGLWWLIWIGCLLYSLHKIYSTRCPHCKKFFALRNVGVREKLGRAKTTKEKDARGNPYTQYWYNYRYTYRCKYCGDTFVEDRVEK